MGPQDPEVRVTGYGKDAADKPGKRAVAYGHQAATSVDVALASIAAALGVGSVTGVTRASFQIPVARRNVVVGEPISLNLTGKLLLGRIFLLLSGSFLKSVTWHIPGTAVKSYSSRHARTRVIPLSEADKSKPQITFYWVDPGSPRRVQAKCVMFSPMHKADITFTFSATFNVQAPRLDHLREHRREQDRGKTRIGSNSAGVAGQRFLEFTGKIEKRTKNGIRRHSGIVWASKVTLPPGHDGKIKDLQTIFGIRELTMRPAVDTTQTVRSVWQVKDKPLVSMPGVGPRPPQGYRVVDSTPNEDPGEPRYSSSLVPIDVKGGHSMPEFTASDSPSNLLNPVLGVRLFIHETFKYFILFKPNRKGAIWVPVGKAEWYWRGEAVRDKNKWLLRGAAGGVTMTGGPTTEFPEYDDHADKLEWVEINRDE